MLKGGFTILRVTGREIQCESLNEECIYSLMIPFHPAITIFIDGIVALGMVRLHGGERVDVHFADRIPQRKLSDTVLDEGNAVQIMTNYIPGIRYFLKEQQGDDITLCYASETIFPKVYDREEVIEYLLVQNYQGEIDQNALSQLCSKKHNASAIVLRTIVYNMPMQDQVVFIGPSTESTWLGQNGMHVKKGQKLLAKLQTASPRVKRTCYGEELVLPPEGLYFFLGVGIVKDGEIIRSARQGRLLIGQHYIDVVSQKVIQGDLAPPEGDLVFPGDVIVEGSVQPGCHLEVMGRVVVRGNVKDAVILADQGIEVEGEVIESSLQAGPLYKVYRLAESLLEEILTGLYQMRDHVRRLQGDIPRKDHVSRLVLIRHARLVKDLNRLYQLRETGLLHKKTYREVMHFIESTWLYHEKFSMNTIEQSLYILQNFQLSLRYFRDIEVASIQIGACMTSIVQASGDIIVTKGHAVSSSLESLHDLTVHGAIKGGFVTVGHAVIADEIGTTSGIETSIRILEDQGFVQATKRHPHTLIEVGSCRTYHVSGK
nr:DUF342 domain-containing protein [Bacilli bacterium]